MPSRVGKGNPEDSAVASLIRARFPLKNTKRPTKEKESNSNKNASALKD